MAIIKSANQLVYEYYHDISSAELKAYALVQLAYMFYTVYNRGKVKFSNLSGKNNLISKYSFPFYLFRTFLTFVNSTINFPTAGNFRSAAQSLRAKYLERTQHTQDIVKHLLQYSKRDVWRCDPVGLK